MFAATKNINCYKGLIFILGFVLASTGYVIKHNQEFEDTFNNVKVMAKDVYNEMSYHTFGEMAYRKYQFGGAREEVSSGVKNVERAYENLNSLNEENLHMTLIKIIENANDSVMLKRANSMEKYQYYKVLISKIKTYDKLKIQQITNECINNNISCGGAADILITAVFISKFAQMYK